MNRISNAAVIVLAAGAGICAPAAATDVVVVRVGDGVATPSTASSPVFLERHAADGTPRGTVALPTSVNGANQPFTLGGTSTSEGSLTLSTDARFLTLAGYAAVPGTASVSTSASASVSRVVASIDLKGNVDTSTQLGATAFNSASVRGAASVDGSAFWLTGNGASMQGGVWYAPLGSVGGGTHVLATPNNGRVITIAQGQLYGDAGSAMFTGVYTIGSGLPTTAGAVATTLPGMSVATASPYGFMLFDLDATPGVDTLYVADDNSVANGGGIQKWTLVAGTWTQQAGFGANFTTGMRGLAAERSGTTVVLYSTTLEPTQNTLVRIVDDGVSAPTASVIATAPANTAYRGVAIAWDVIFADGFE